MKQLIKPNKLNIGDTIATISLSGGAAGENNLLPWYNIAKGRLQEIFGLQVIETEHALKGRRYIYENPQARAYDLMEALLNPKIKAIFLNQGGDDAIRILPYIDFDIIREYPKIFMGFSDATTIHFIFMKSGISSFYGPNVLTTLSESVQLHSYTEKWIKIVLFHTNPIGNIEPADYWTNKMIDWENGINQKRVMTKSSGYELLQGNGVVKGRLIGGSAAPLTYMIKGTSLFPKKEEWKETIIFLDSTNTYAPVQSFIHMLRGLASARIFDNANGLIISRPVNDDISEQLKQAVLQVIRDEEGLTKIPILLNVDCGHTAPINVLPYGAMAQINCEEKSFCILEPGVID